MNKLTMPCAIRFALMLFCILMIKKLTDLGGEEAAIYGGALFAEAFFIGILSAVKR